MRATTVLALTAPTAALVVNCSKFAVSGSETSGILTDAQLAPPVIEPDDDLTLSLRLRAHVAKVQGHPELQAAHPFFMLPAGMPGP
jgi:hypothetical protein